MTKFETRAIPVRMIHWTNWLRRADVDLWRVPSLG